MAYARALGWEKSATLLLQGFAHARCIPSVLLRYIVHLVVLGQQSYSLRLQ